MSDFKAKMHQIRFRLGLRPRPAPPDPVAGFEGPTSKGGAERGRDGGEGRGGKTGGEGRGGGRREGEEAFLVMWPKRLSALNPPLTIDTTTNRYRIQDIGLCMQNKSS